MLFGKQFSSCGIVSVRNHVTADLCTHLSSELNTLRASRPPFVFAMQQCSGGTICSASCIIFGISSIEDGCFECSKFHVDIYFRYLGFRSQFSLLAKELLFRGGFSKAGELLLRGGFFLVELLFRDRFSVFWRIIEVPTCWRRITKAPACWWRITKAPAYCWRIIEASTCLVGGLSSFLLVWLALQVLLLAAEGGFNWFFNRYCSRLCGRLFGVIYAAFPSGYFVVKAVSLMKVYILMMMINVMF